MWRARYVLGLSCVLGLYCQVVRAEGSADFDVADTGGFNANDQAVNTGTVAYVDILDAGNEKICYRGNGTQLSVYRPRPNQTMLVGNLNSGQCVTSVAGVGGAYLLDIGTQTMGTEWDIRVCDKMVSNANCLNMSANERLGRLWSYDWSFQSNLLYSRNYSVNGSIYAIVPGGAEDHDAVVEMQMRGVSGARYHLFANSYGPESGTGQRIGRSAPRTNNNKVTPEYPIYLNPPAAARYNWIEPVVSSVQISPECGTAVVAEVAPGKISFESNIVGQYIVICDVNKDNIYNFADNADFSSFGDAVVGVNTVSWDGRSKGGTFAAPGDYKCVIRLNVGEFHFMAEDIETSDPGIRMFRVEKEVSGTRARTGIRMFWDDTLVPNDTERVPSNDELSPRGSPPEGLDPGAYMDAFAAYYLNGSTPTGNARAWGNYDEDGKGNETFLDQFTSAASAQSQPITITVMSKDGDPDMDGLTTVRECELHADPRNPDTDGDEVNDGFEASASNAPNSDEDTLIDILDNDDDGDGIATKDELGKDENGDGQPDDAVDTDGDSKPDYLDTDSDGDNVSDKDDVARTEDERCRDSDADGCDDCSGGQGPDPANDGADSNGDGRCDAADDADKDGITDSDDKDIDDDGIPNDVEGSGDFDEDGIPNSYDLDSDGDGLPDILEAGGGELDSDHNGRIDAIEDSAPKDGLHDPLQASGGALPRPDSDGDGMPDFLDLDADGDGIYDVIEGGDAERTSKLDADDDGRIDDDADSNHNGLPDLVDPEPSLADKAGEPLDAPDTNDDGTPDFQDPDDDGDGRSTKDERDDAERYGDDDVDDDGSPNWRDADSDGDNVSDEYENHGDGDINDDDIPDYVQPEVHVDGDDIDSDGDGLTDAQERPDGEQRDTDGDLTPDHLDDDDDGDGVPTRDERPDGQDVDTDDDGVPDHLDADDDGDGVRTSDERPGDQSIDTDDDGKPDYMDVDDDDDGVNTYSERGDANDDGTPDRLQVPNGTLAGGALCSVSTPGAAHSGSQPWLCAGLLLALLWLRRMRAVWLALALLSLASNAHAQVAVDQFKPAPLASDGFGVSRPDVSGHMVLGATLWLDYANDPLVYEVKKGESKGQEHVVRDHFVLHAGLSLGLGDRVSLFALLPVHLVMKGQRQLSLRDTAPEGAGLGDFALGARIRLLGDVSSAAALSGELVARLPTAELANNDQHYSGDAVGSYEPALIGEVRSGPFDVRLRVGARLRKSAKIGNLDLDQELVYGLGARMRVTEAFSLHAEVYGSTFFKDAFERTYTPLELLAGGKLQLGDLILGVAAGPGLFQGYGSPDVRIVGLVGYAPAPQKRVEVPDSDGDGLLDPDDQCPKEPEDSDNFQDEDGCPDPDNDQDGVMDIADRCPLLPEDIDQFEDNDGCADPDNDHDGVLDAADRCPLDPEDRDQFEDDDGCKDPDNDRDGRPDAQDKCPNDPEDLDGFEDSDGCAEEGAGLVKLTCERIEIKEAVYFDTSADTIQQRSFALLDQVAGLLVQAQHIKRVRVEGHTDNRGKPQYNLELSKRRAASVVRYLTEHGVDSARLESEGYGLGKPIADNKTEQGRAANRRVDFIVVEQSSQCK